MNIYTLFLLLITSTVYGRNDVVLKPFLTDFCTSYAEGTRSQPDLWKHCCIEHDLYFWAGGSKADRKATDIRLRDCVAATGAETHARLIYTAVSIGGASPIRFKTKQWGHAFENRERYQSLSLEETNLVIEALKPGHPHVPGDLFSTFKNQLYSRLGM